MTNTKTQTPAAAKRETNDIPFPLSATIKNKSLLALAEWADTTDKLQSEANRLAASIPKATQDRQIIDSALRMAAETFNGVCISMQTLEVIGEHTAFANLLEATTRLAGVCKHTVEEIIKITQATIADRDIQKRKARGH